MIRNIIFSVFLLCVFNIQAQVNVQTQEMKALNVIKLNDPDKTRGSAIMKALNDRQTIREYSTESLRPQDLSDLLWAANGINRPDGRRTAPTARNLQEVEMYVIFPFGAYWYDYREHSLIQVATGDYRRAVAGSQDFAAAAPMSIVLVADMTKYGDNMNTEQSKLMAAVDIGIVCQNINIACAGLGLATVPRGTMDHATLKTALNLKDTHLLLMNNPVGYPIVELL